MTLAAKGTASQAARQLTSASSPADSVATIAAAGGPISAQDSARVRLCGSAHRAGAAVPAVTTAPSPAPIAICATVSAAKSGASVAASELAATRVRPATSSRRNDIREDRRPSPSVAAAAASPDTARSCPTAATGTANSTAKPGGSGASTNSADCAANVHSTGAGADVRGPFTADPPKARDPCPSVACSPPSGRTVGGRPVRGFGASTQTIDRRSGGGGGTHAAARLPGYP